MSYFDRSVIPLLITAWFSFVMADTGDLRMTNFGLCALFMCFRSIDAQIFPEVEQPWWDTFLLSKQYTDTSVYQKSELNLSSKLHVAGSMNEKLSASNSASSTTSTKDGLPDYVAMDFKHVSLLSSRQKYLDNYNGLEKILFESTNLALRECRRLSRHLLWRCPTYTDTITGGKSFSFELKKFTKEFSYVSTLNSAALMYKIREGCMQGELRFCDCRYNPDSTTRLNETHTLDKDCSEIHKMPRDLSRKFTDKPLLPPDRQFFLETAVVLHNYLLGRKLAEKQLKLVCRCSGTGVSGSCVHKVCWQSLSFPEVANSIRKRYTNAIRVKLGNEFSSKTELPNLVPTDDPFEQARKTQMVYSSMESEAVCLESGAECPSETANHKECEISCCSGQFEVIRREIAVECNCVFHWCCQVECQVCYDTKEQPICK